LLLLLLGIAGFAVFVSEIQKKQNNKTVEVEVVGG
jgi:uncharacterized membrane protein YqhA